MKTKSLHHQLRDRTSSCRGMQIVNVSVVVGRGTAGRAIEIEIETGVVDMPNIAPEGT